MTAAAVYPDHPAGARSVDLPRRVRAIVPIEPMLGGLRAATALGSNIFALMRRVMLVIMQRIARAFNVNLEHKGLADDDSRAEAAFTGDPDFADNVTAAAASTTQQLSAFIEEALKGGSEGAAAKLAALNSTGGAAAYLAMTLDHLSGAMRSTQAQLQEQEGPLQEQLLRVASRLNVEPDSLRELLSAPGNANSLPDDPELAALSAGFTQLAEAKQQLVRLKVGFCDYCVAARALDGDGPIGTLANHKAQQFSDSSLLKAIELAAANGYNGKEEELKNPQTAVESPLKSGNAPEQPAQQQAVAGAAQAAQVSRAGFRGKAYFVVDGQDGEASDPDFDDASSELKRMRQR